MMRLLPGGRELRLPSGPRPIFLLLLAALAAVAPAHASEPLPAELRTDHLVPGPLMAPDAWKGQRLDGPRRAPEHPTVSPLQSSFDALHYDISLFPFFDSEFLGGVVAMRFEALDHGMSHIELDLYDSWNVGSVTFNGIPASFTHSGDKLAIDLPRALGTGMQGTVTVVYSGFPQPAGFMGMEFNQHDGVPILATLSEPYYARSWWPCKDTPVDKATVTLRCQVRDDFFVASNGNLVDVLVEAPGTKTYVWQENYPITTYNVSIAATNYESWSETWTSPSGRQMELEYHVFPEDLEVAQYEFARTSQILDLYASYFGEYPFLEEKYGMAEFVWQGAMEHQTMSSYGDFFLTGDRFYERIIGHELAHQWWGNLMTVSNWDEIWLHEGFATYSEALWIEHIQGKAAYDSFMRSREYENAKFWGPVVPPLQLFGSTTYFKGAWVLHMLRHLLGDAEFFGGLADLAQMPAAQYGNVTTADLVASLEASTGQELSWFFDQWLYREGRPEFQYSWTTVPMKGQWELRLELVQVQAGEPYQGPIDVRVETAGGPVDLQGSFSGGTTILKLPVAGQPTGVTLDPGNWLLARYAEVAPTAAPGLAPVARLLPASPNPFNPRTRLRFSLDGPGEVTLRVLDTRGRLVDVLRSGRLQSGEHSLPWAGRDAQGRPLASGVYQVLLEGPGGVQRQPVTLLK